LTNQGFDKILGHLLRDIGLHAGGSGRARLTAAAQIEHEARIARHFAAKARRRQVAGPQVAFNLNKQGHIYFSPIDISLQRRPIPAFPMRFAWFDNLSALKSY
jgi:hypothetical protein